MNAVKADTKELPYNPDAGLISTEGVFADILRKLTHNNDRLLYIYVFTAIVIATVIITLIRSFIFFSVSITISQKQIFMIQMIHCFFFQIAMRASRNLHNTMFNGVTRARMYFFHTNPSGRILNRFSKDMGQVDEILPSVMIDVIQIFLQLGGIIIVIAIVNYYFIIPTLIVGIIFYYLRVYYLSSSRNIKRIEATSKLMQFHNYSTQSNERTVSNYSPVTDLFAFKCITEWLDNHSVIWCAKHIGEGV